MNLLIEALEPRHLLNAHFHDGTFLSSNWSATQAAALEGGSTSSIRVQRGGHPGPYESVTCSVNNATPFVDGPEVWSFHAYRKGIYDPAKRGAIFSFNYSEDAMLVAGSGPTRLTGPALLQDGTIYFCKWPLSVDNHQWTHLTAEHLGADTFFTADGLHHPDFSRAGSTIQFGFYRATSTFAYGYSVISAIDNWSIMIKTAHDS
jgi:hypothetical protein